MEYFQSSKFAEQVQFDIVRHMAYIRIMGFREVRRRVIQALKEGRIQHEARGNVDEKNLLLVGDITTEQVIHLLTPCKGTEYSTSPHHLLPEIKVHIFKPQASLYVGWKKEGWYVKLYFLEPDVWFISVHRSMGAKP